MEAASSNIDALKERLRQLTQAKQQRFADFAKLQPNHPFTIANKDVLNLATQTTWDATGVLTMTGVLWWALNLSVDLAYPHSVIFNATGGPDMDLAVFSSVVTGYFTRDPSTLHGEYNFTIQSVAGGVGEVSITLYDMNWSEVGYFFGAVVGGAFVPALSGTGTLTYY